MEQRMASLERENAVLRKEVGNIAETRQAVAADAASRDRPADGFYAVTARHDHVPGF
jgi:hypothetical protein